ncbi:MAG: ATP-binding protein [Eubacteriales bacterium]|nr:ATP-binding protein [Eubacteriales bacterium]
MIADKLDIEAAVEKLPDVQTFVETYLDTIGCSLNTMMQISVAVEEIFINIAHYAYPAKNGRATVLLGCTENSAKKPVSVSITFVDSGIPYNPLAKKDPDVTLSVHERQIGGLGIFMAKKIMDHVTYEYKDGKNILTLEKAL